MNQRLNKLLSLFHLKEIEKELFERIFDRGQVSASELARQSNITRTSVYDYLKHLKEQGLIAQILKRGVRIFISESPEKIQLLIEEQEKQVETAKEALPLLREGFEKTRFVTMPQLRVFEGRQALQQMMKDLLLYRGITVLVWWPIVRIIELLTSEFLEEFNRKRIERNISLQTIWPEGQIPSLKKYPFLVIGPEQKREVRIAPQGVDFSLGYAIYGTTVRFISSSKECFGFLVESVELADTMRKQFEILWKVSKPFRFK